MRIVIAVTAAVTTLVVATSTASARTLRSRTGVNPIGVLIPTHPGAPLSRHGGTMDSLNWSGYAVTPGSGITAVSGTFIVPAAGLIPPGFAATWAGIGGFNTPDLIQAGVGEQSLPDTPILGPQYFAWYELLPGPEIPLTGCTGDTSCAVHPGDAISVSITESSPNQWTISMDDAGHWTYSNQVNYNSSGSSAEWILEAPSLIVQTILAPVGTVHFGPTSTFSVGTTTKTIAQGSPTQLIMTPGLINEATPSALSLSDGQSFNVCAYAQSCPAPAGVATVLRRSASKKRSAAGAKTKRSRRSRSHTS